MQYLPNILALPKESSVEFFEDDQQCLVPNSTKGRYSFNPSFSHPTGLLHGRTVVSQVAEEDLPFSNSFDPFSEFDPMQDPFSAKGLELGLTPRDVPVPERTIEEEVLVAPGLATGVNVGPLEPLLAPQGDSFLSDLGLRLLGEGYLLHDETSESSPSLSSSVEKNNRSNPIEAFSLSANEGPILSLSDKPRFEAGENTGRKLLQEGVAVGLPPLPEALPPLPVPPLPLPPLSLPLLHQPFLTASLPPKTFSLQKGKKGCKEPSSLQKEEAKGRKTAPYEKAYLPSIPLPTLPFPPLPLPFVHQPFLTASLPPKTFSLPEGKRGCEEGNSLEKGEAKRRKKASYEKASQSSSPSPEVLPKNTINLRSQVAPIKKEDVPLGSKESFDAQAILIQLFKDRNTITIGSLSKNIYNRLYVLGKKLKVLDLTDCPLKEFSYVDDVSGIVVNLELKSLIACFVRLTSLTLDARHLTDEHWHQLGEFKKLTYLHLKNCVKFTPKGLVAFRKVSTLRTLIIDGASRLTKATSQGKALQKKALEQVQQLFRIQGSLERINIDGIEITLDKPA